MATVKSHDCKMCGGALEIDPDKQIYRCNFCGISYDYEYFREDNVIDLAQTAISRSEFGSAQDAYDFILKKDPHDFAALRGKLLCSCKWKSIHPILHMNRVYLKSDSPTLTYAIDNSLPEHKAYFTQIQDLVDVISRYKETQQQFNDLEDDKVAEIKIRNSIMDEQMVNNRLFLNTVDHLRESKTPKGDSVFDIFLGFGALLVIGATAWLGWLVLIVLASLIGCIAISYNVKKAATNKKLMNEMKPHTIKIEHLDDECDAKKKEAEIIKSEYLKKAKAIVAKDLELTKAS